MLRVVFMGTPDFAVPTLAGVLAAGHAVVAVYTQPPRPAGRGMAERKSPVQLLAERHGLPGARPAQPEARSARLSAFAAHRADVAVVVAYGLILPRPVLAAPRHGCFNLHASALPRWRGAAPIQRAIMAGDAETAATVMRMEEGLDTGPGLPGRSASPIGPEVTAGELHDDARASAARALMVRALADLERGRLDCTPQPAEGVTYAAKIDKAEARIDFTRPAREVHNLIRGLSPVPGRLVRGHPRGAQGAHQAAADASWSQTTPSGPPGTRARRRAHHRLRRRRRAHAAGATLRPKPMAAAEFLRGFPLPRRRRL